MYSRGVRCGVAKRAGFAKAAIPFFQLPANQCFASTPLESKAFCRETQTHGSTQVSDLRSPLPPYSVCCEAAKLGGAAIWFRFEDTQSRAESGAASPSTVAEGRVQTTCRGQQQQAVGTAARAGDPRPHSAGAGHGVAPHARACEGTANRFGTYF